MGFVGTLLNNTVNNDWSQIGRQIAVAGISAVTSFLLPGFGTLSSNLFLNIGLHAVIGAAQGAVIGGISSMVMGGTFAQGIVPGAIGGAIGGALQGITTSEQFGNWKNDKGWLSNREVENANKNWIGYGEDQYKTLMSDSPEYLKQYQSDSSIYFRENPTWGEYQGALKDNYKGVYLHTHGDPSKGLLFKDGWHNLGELKGMTGAINAKTVGVSSCFPWNQSAQWNSLKVNAVTYQDLSAVSRYARYPTSNTNGGIENVHKAVYP